MVPDAMMIHLHGATDLELTSLNEPGMHIHGDADGEGFSALQMLACSLVLCTGSVLAAYAEGVLSASIERLSLRVRWEYADNPYRVGSMHVTVTWPEVPDDRIEAVKRAVKTCTVHRTFEHPPEIRTDVRNR